MKNFHDPFLPNKTTSSPGNTLPDLPAKKPARRRGPSKKVLKQKAAAQPRDSNGKFTPDSNFLTRGFQVLQGQHKAVIKRSRAASKRMERQQRNRRYEQGEAVIPLAKKPVKRRKKPASHKPPAPRVSEYRQGVLSSLLPWNWRKKK